ncbi:alpha/beta fold hydrolase [Corynebacterium sp. P6145]|uniref:esterase/lipase family protein n=1 Tax=Corynebacterium antarcticum TaxID=2800405 RepID=UPI00200484BE|nr:alpha/beta fold hydrolase [Corynebacterium antarcticum]MCK7643399.1 alpha/beta fold hydrolase [Corynebacterium antarcticum]
MRDLSARLPRLIPELDVSVPVGARLRVRGWVEDDWRARPTPERPWPVILIHGTTVTSGDFEDLTTQLRALGWAVFIPDYGNRATNRIEDSAEQVGAYIDQVLHATGADRVIIIGHSQGGVLARWWMRMLGGARHVRHLICLASPNHGIREAGLLRPLVLTERQAELTTRATETVFGPAGRQQFTGSAFLTALNADGDTEPELHLRRHPDGFHGRPRRLVLPRRARGGEHLAAGPPPPGGGVAHGNAAEQNCAHPRRGDPRVAATHHLQLKGRP